MTYEIILKVVPQDGFYLATAYLVAADIPLFQTEPQLSRSQNRAASYALTELATLFDRHFFCTKLDAGASVTNGACLLAPGHEGPCRSTR